MSAGRFKLAEEEERLPSQRLSIKGLFADLASCIKPLQSTVQRNADAFAGREVCLELERVRIFEVDFVCYARHP